MRNAVILVLFSCTVLPCFGQNGQEISPNRHKIKVTPDQIQSTSAETQLQKSVGTISILKPIKIKFADEVENFFTLALNWPKIPGETKVVSFEYREKRRGKWRAWQKLPIDQHAEEESIMEVSELRQIDARVRFIQVKIILPAGVEIPADLNINLFNPVIAPQKSGAALIKPLAPELRGCPCPLPGMVSRQTWGAPRPCASPGYATVTHLIVHHSAGVNTSNNWAQVVLAIWDFHVNTRAYCDIAYNYLIDPNGVLYEGRSGGNNVIGAHFCNTNTGTMGVCLLGNFQEVEPTTGMLNKLADLLAWKSCNSSIDPVKSSVFARSNTVLNHISGHRDGCATECPGNNVFVKLVEMRSKVASSIVACALTVATQNPTIVDYSVDIVPNPAQHSFRLRLSNGANISRLELYNLMGQALRVQYNLQTLEVQCGDLPRGTYVLKITDTAQKSIAKQVVLQF